MLHNLSNEMCCKKFLSTATADDVRLLFLRSLGAISTNMAATVGLVLKKGVSSLITSSPKGLFQQQIPSVFFSK